MAIVLALITAVVYGIGDFCGGLATRTVRVVQVLAGSHLIGAVGAVLASLVLAEQFVVRDAVLGVIGGLFGLVGVALLYRRLAAGPMSVVAPLTGVTSAVVPATWGLIGGDRLGSLGWLGLVLGLVAVVLVSLVEGNPETDAPVTAMVVIESLLSGVGFGLLFIFYDATSEASAPWPVATARIVTAAVMVVVAVVVVRRATGSNLAARSLVPDDGAVIGLIIAAGLADTTANVTFILAIGLGQLSVVSVLAALYPVSTVLLAAVVLRERMTMAQGFGFVAAMAATALLSVG